MQEDLNINIVLRSGITMGVIINVNHLELFIEPYSEEKGRNITLLLHARHVGWNLED